MAYFFSSKLSLHTRNLFKNAGILLTGNIISSIFSIVTIALMTRALSLEDFGRYALLTAFIGLIDRLVNFQAWQALIHFGASAHKSGDDGKLISLFSFGWCLDVATGVVGYFLVIVLSMFIPHWFGLGEHATLFVAIGGCSILFNWTATPIAILRLYDKFYLQALYQKITAGLMLLCTIVLLYSNQDTILPFVIALTLSGLAGKAFLYAVAVRELHRRQLLNTEKIDFVALLNTTPRLWRFIITSNLDGVVRVFRDVDIFIVNALLGPVSVALYKIARSLTTAFGMLTGPFFQAIYPELSKLFAGNRMHEFTTLMKTSAKSLGLLTLSAWLVFLVVGPMVLEYGFGEDYVRAFGVVSLCMAAMVIWSIALPLSPAMMALGKVEISLIIHVVTTLVYLAMLVVFAGSFGLLGSGLALLMFYLLWSVAMLFSVNNQLRVTRSI
jgi:O-antigen/teichoic acid export membrane protein